MQSHSIANAPPATSAILEMIEESTGFIPSVYALLANSPNALAASTGLNGIFAESSFDAQEQEIISLATSVANECAYCVAGHTFFALAAGLPAETVDAIRQGRPADSDRHQLLHAFTVNLVRNRGALGASEIETLNRSGFSFSQVLELLVGVAAKTLTNYASKLAGIELDEAFIEHAWSGDTTNANSRAKLNLLNGEK